MSDDLIALIVCPRCKQNTLRIWRHVCHRLRCSCPEDDTPEFDGKCENPSCDFPGQQGVRDWLRRNPGKPTWDGPNGGYPDEEIAQIMEQPYEELPAPYNTRKPIPPRELGDLVLKSPYSRDR